jgi:hypothetical protein
MPSTALTLVLDICPTGGVLPPQRVEVAASPILEPIGDGRRLILIRGLPDRGLPDRGLPGRGLPDPDV